MQNITPKRLIISRTDSIGDVILTLPVAGELKLHTSHRGELPLGG